MGRIERTDREIAQEAVAELRWELSGPTGIRVEAMDGVVVLSGSATTTDERRRAVAVAHRVPGVLDVVDAVGVVVSGTPAAADLVLLHSVRRALEWESFAPDERIQTTVANGWITLRGSVDHVADASDAQRAVRLLAEVKGVTNLLEVGWMGRRAAALNIASALHAS